MTLTEGQTVGAYELVRKLGEGAFGEVWLGRHAELGAERALKIPTDPDYVKQLRREGKIQFDLKHPNIVETIDLNTTYDPPHFVMEYVEGPDLRKTLAARKSLPVPEALAILRQVLDALSTAHGHGIVHGDLKPENILVAAGGTVKVADFGLGRVQSEVAQSLLLSGSIVSSEGKSISGTFAYMSPEQQLGAGGDPRDDVYAAGVIGCELLTGSRPSGVGVAKMFQRAGLDPALASVFERALDEAERRYASAGEMLADLERLHAPGPPPLAAQPTPLAAPPPMPVTAIPVAGPKTWYERIGHWLCDMELQMGIGAAKPTPFGAVVLGWADWLHRPEAKSYHYWLVASTLLTLGLCVLCPFSMVAVDPEAMLGLFVVGLIVITPFWIGFGVWNSRLRNAYHLACAEACLRGGDHVTGLEYARRIKPSATNPAQARAVLAGLTDLAQRAADAFRAQELAVLAARWL